MFYDTHNPIRDNQHFCGGSDSPIGGYHHFWVNRLPRYIASYSGTGVPKPCVGSWRLPMVCTSKAKHKNWLIQNIFVLATVRLFAQHLIKCNTSTMINLTFMGPCIVNVFKHNQQHATLHNGIYYYKCSTCFRRFLRPSSGAQNCIHSIRYLSIFYCFLPLAWVSWDCLLLQTSSTNTRCCVYSFELPMMGGGTAWNV